MTGKQVDWLNIGLVIISLLAAFWVPFHLFLFAYALLGPLHYLTEINWLRDKEYFVREKRWVWLAPAFAFLLVIPPVFSLFVESEESAFPAFQEFMHAFRQWSNSLIFLWFVFSIGLVTLTNRLHLAILGGSAVVIAIALHSVDTYLLLFGLLVPTLIHVYVFTLIFMLYGALNSTSKPGLVATALVALAPFVIAFADLDTVGYAVSDGIKDTFAAGNFHTTNTTLAHFFGFGDGKTFSFERLLDIRFQVFVTFAYTYHYLNWFSKTNIIRWHETLNVRRVAIIGTLWLGSVALYWYDFAVGLVALLFLSVLHVLLEFPLNVISIRGVGKALIFGGKK